MEVSYEDGESIYMDDLNLSVIEVDVNNNSMSSVTISTPTKSIELMDDFHIQPSTSTPVAKKFVPSSKKRHHCKVCKFSSMSRGNVYRHTQSVHKKRTSMCSICKKTFTALYDLKQHKRSVHQNIKLMCEVCSKEFNNRFTLSRHRMKEHSQSSRHVCKMCGKRFFEKANYLGHINMHVQSKPYCCGECNKTFGYKSSYTRHIKSCNGTNTYNCDTCGASLGSKETLTAHIKGKHGPKNLLCACGKSFSWKASISRHTKTCTAGKIPLN